MMRKSISLKGPSSCRRLLVVMMSGLPSISLKCCKCRSRAVISVVRAVEMTGTAPAAMVDQNHVMY